MASALITGATAGIGLAFARSYAARGSDLVLVSRNQQRLQSTAHELAASYGVQVEVLPADLTTRAGTDRVCDLIGEGVLGINALVNSAGFALCRPFAENSLDDEQRMLDILVGAVMRLTHSALAMMAPRRRGDIINVSSVAGFTARGTYGAHKAWVTSFTRWLSLHYRDQGVRAMALCPGFVRTEFHQRMGTRTDNIPRWLWLDADRVVARAHRDLEAGVAVSIPTLRYRVLTAAARLAPAELAAKVAKRGR